MTSMGNKLIALTAVVGLLFSACGSDGEGAAVVQVGDNVSSAVLESEVTDATPESDSGSGQDSSPDLATDESIDVQAVVPDDATPADDDQSDADTSGGSQDADGNDPAADGEDGCDAEAVVCIGLVTAAGGQEPGFNSLATAGVVAAGVELEATVALVESETPADHQEDVDALVESGYDVVITVGDTLAEATRFAAAANPDVYFVVVDQQQTLERPNVARLVFDEDRLGFLAGATAGLLSADGTVAQILATDIDPAMRAMRDGFEAGVLFTNPDADVISTYHPGGLDTAFDDPSWGASIARQDIDYGADVIFAAGGETAGGALVEVASEGGSVLCIGVEIDQWEVVPSAQSCLVTSAIKDVSSGVAEIISLWHEGTPPSGDHVAAVALADFHDLANRVPSRIKARLSELTADVVAGRVATGYVPD